MKPYHSLSVGVAFAALIGLYPADFVQAQPVVQAIPSPEAAALSSALSRLARNPRDIDALIAAGNAALASGDVDAAIGFFDRAGQIAPTNPKVKAGLAGALVRNEDPYSALPLFDEAEAAGVLDGNLLADRGLAYDLLADNATAQRFYRQAAAKGGNEEAIRRLALSLAIAGDKRGSELTLTPLLQRQDRASSRTRAFALAISGREEEAVALTRATMPQELASGIAPYLRYMRRLTPAQQAAAANLGHFPRASEIGRDDPRIAQYLAARGSKLASADTALIPKGEPLGRKPEPPTKVTLAKPPEAKPVPLAVAKPPIAAAPIVPAPAPLVPPAVVAPAKPVTPPVASGAGVTAPNMAGAGNWSLSPATGGVPNTTPIPAPTAAPTPAPVLVPPASSPILPPPVTRPSLADAFADMAAPSSEIGAAAGAVDMRRIKPAREGEDPAKTTTPSQPSRFWVELGIGRDRATLWADFKRLSARYDELLAGRKAFATPWKQTNMMLTGPFESASAADNFAAKIRKAGLAGAFVWTSPAGQVVDSLGAK